MSYYIIVDIRSFHFISFHIYIIYIYMSSIMKYCKFMIYLCHVTFDMFG